MLISFSIYILGIIAYLIILWVGYHKLDKGTEVTLDDLLYYLVLGGFSWITFFAGIIMIYGDTPILKKK